MNRKGALAAAAVPPAHRDPLGSPRRAQRPPPAFPAPLSPCDSERGRLRALIYISSASGQWAGNSGFCNLHGPRRWPMGWLSRIPLGRRCVTQREAGPGAGTCRARGLGSAAAPGSRGGKMSVAGLKKQFHKASQVRGAVPGAGAVAEPQRGLCCWRGVRPAPAPGRPPQGAADSSTTFWVAASPRGAVPSASPLGPPFIIASCVDPYETGLPVSGFCLGFQVLLLVTRICYLMLLFNVFVL